MSLQQNSLVRVDHRLLNAKVSLSNNESDLFYTILNQISKEQSELKAISFSLHDLEERTDKTWSFSQFKTTTKNLQGKVFEIEISKNKWNSYNPIPTIEFNNGLVTCYLNQQMLEYFLDLKRFGLGDIKAIYGFRSAYIKRIYLFMEEYKKIGKRNFSVTDLMDLLQVPKSYRAYKKLKEKILIPAIEEINKNTGLYIKLFEDKKGTRGVKVLKFDIKGNWGNFQAFKRIIRTEKINEKLIDISFHGNDGKPTEITISINKSGDFYDHYNKSTIWKLDSVKNNIWDKLYEERKKIFSVE